MEFACGWTSWNRVAEALEKLPSKYGDYTSTFCRVEEDFPVRLVPLIGKNGRPVSGWLEVEAVNEYGSYDTCLFDSSGRRTFLYDWLYVDGGPAPERELVENREGIAVPAEIVKLLREDAQGKIIGI